MENVVKRMIMSECNICKTRVKNVYVCERCKRRVCVDCIRLRNEESHDTKFKKQICIKCLIESLKL